MTAAPLRRLALLAGAVLAVHLVLLGAAPQQLVLHPPVQATRTFVVRQVAAEGPAQAPAPAPAAAKPAADAPTSIAVPAPVLPAPEPAQAAAAPASQPAAAAPPPAPQPAIEAASVQPTVLPDPVRVHYDVTIRAKGLTVPARAQLDWRHDGGTYEARMEVDGALIPKRVQESAGAITPQGLAPSRFSDHGRNEEATHFERGQGKLVFSNNRPEQPLQAGMQDRLSVVVQLTMLVAGDPGRFQPGVAIAIPTASTRDAETWVFTVQGEEDLQLPGGNVRALKLQRNPRKEYDQQVELWLAPRMDYAPVRLRLTNPNGDSSDLRWASTDKG
ncbi:MAG: DUF3108 domain-containing protein [Pseudomonadota bacterium]